MDLVSFRHFNLTMFENESFYFTARESAVFNQSNMALAEQLNEEFKKAILPVTVFVGLEVVLGFFGNLLVLYVFSFHYHVCNFRYFVIRLAIIDVTSSVTTIPGEIVTQLYSYVYPIRELCKIKSFFNVFTVSAEAMCLLTIAFDRYRKICQPFRWQIQPRIAIYGCAAIFAVAAILAVPVAILWGTHSHPKVFKGVAINVTVCEKDEHFQNTKYPLTYSLTVEILVLICLALMLVLYVIIARKLLKEKQEKRRAYSTPPTVVVTAATTSVTDISCNINTVHSPSDFSNTGFSSYLGMNEEIRKDLKDTTITSDEETDAHETKTSLKVPTNGKHDLTFKSRHSPNSTRKLGKKMNISERVRRKTLIILFILTLIFIATTVLYLTLLSFIAKSDDILQDMSNGDKAVYFFFFRLYFLNHVINPIVYGLLDPRFKKVMQNCKMFIARK